MNSPPDNFTFLFTDIEGSTRLWEQRPDEMPAVIARHDELLRTAIESNKGRVFKTVGDAFCAVFERSTDAISAAVAGQVALATEFGCVRPDSTRTVRVRMAIHSGHADERDGDYFGRPLNRIARLLATAHGGQIILSEPARASISSLPSGVSTLDLGHHRLKDLLEPEAVHQIVYQGLPAEFPPLLSLRSYRNNLPSYNTSFIGREREQAEVRDLLTRSRMVTLCGAGGTGKTRLSQQVAAELIDRFADGVWLVELAGLTDPDLLPSSVASALQVTEEPGRNIGDTLVRELKDKELLLILDNCEHLIEASARIADSLIRGCPKLRILATSREPLQVYGEFTYRVPSLDVPSGGRRMDLRAAEECASIRLFQERAAAVSSGFRLTNDNVGHVASICSRLDGIPLAIELGAARVRAMSVDMIAQRLDNQFGLLTQGNRTALPRQQTLRALIDWSWDLLDTREKVVFRRLSVFAGGLTLEAAEAVCSDPNGEEIESWEVLDLLSQLVDKSVVLAEPGSAGNRFRLMETIRSYAVERLAESGETAGIYRRHFSFFLGMGQEAESQIEGPRTQEWLDTLQTEHDNIRAALGRAETAEDRLRLASAVHRFWLVRGFLTEGRRWLESALLPTEITDEILLARGFNRAGVLAWRQGDFVGARPLLESSLAIWYRIGDRVGAAGTLNNLGLVSDDDGDQTAARAYYEQAAEIYRDVGERTKVGMVLANLGVLLIAQRDFDAAEAVMKEFLAISEDSQDPWCQGTALHNLAEVARQRGDMSLAASLGRQALAVIGGLGDSTQTMQLLLLAAYVANSRQEHSRAVIMLSAANSLRLEHSLYLVPAEEDEYHEALSIARDGLSADEFASLWSQGARLKLANAMAEALDDQTGEH